MKFLKITALIFTIVFFMTSCGNKEDWVEIFVENKSDSTVGIAVNNKYTKDGEYYYHQVALHTNFIPGETFRYEGPDGNYMIEINTGKTSYYYPKGKSYLNMSGAVRLVFTGTEFRKK